ncbi:nuclear transport factor 2 family protein [Kribbella sp. HUAS MG21]|uniref:Nuclear transport factor 2 family protein n=1 Tax=Kribbella sp. HUAS MG21 TaxID=3160966 RepID=A0AAU7T712_9ACTN
MSRVAEHVDAFNQAVATGDWDGFAGRFAADASMTFAGVPVGPFHGRAAIAAAYREDPPTDTMTVLDVRTYDGTDSARFRWTDGGTGTMELTWTPDGAVQALTVRFDPGA